MKIALFTETYLPDVNGVAAHVDTLRLGLQELGHEVLVVAADKRVRKHYIENGVLHCPSLESKRFYGFGIASPVSSRRSHYIKDFSPDIIHIHHEFGIGLSGITAARRLEIPLIYTLHTMYDMYVHYISSGTFNEFAKKFSHRYEKYVAQHATILASPSRKGEEYFKTIGINRKFYLIPNSADLKLFNYDIITREKREKILSKLGIPTNKTVACFVGRLGQEKSIDILLKYWANTITEQDNLHLLIMGDGPDKALLENLAVSLGIEDMVTFTGRIEHDDIPEYFASCDIFTTASLSEMNSISMLEGMATGLPSVQRFDELNQDQIEVGINGYHFNNAEEMATQLKKIASLSDNEKLELKKKVRDSVINRDSKGLAEYILDIYEKGIELKAAQIKTRV